MTLPLRWLVCLAAIFAAAGALSAQDAPIDWDKARALHRKEVQGLALTPDERAYVDRAKAAMAAGERPTPPAGGNRGGAAGAGGIHGSPNGPVGLPPPKPWTTHLTPLTELGTATYQGQDGGLYGGGRNVPPADQVPAIRRTVRTIVPLGPDGQPAADGKIVLLSVGMSNTTMEFSRFKSEADRDPAKSDRVVIVDGAQGGQTAEIWAKPGAKVWPEVARRLQHAGVTAAQVEVVWLKQADAGPARFGAFPRHARVLQEHLVSDLQLLKQHFPNLRVAYLSSRIYAGYATTALNPEPYAYESAFAVRWVIQDQMAGKAELNDDPAHGPVKAPLVLWGPYLWADGTTPRKSDGLVWEKKDLSDKDGTHPSEPSRREKVAQMLLKFFDSSPTTRPWFIGRPAAAPAPEAGPIDPAKGRALMVKARQGEPLTDEEQAYLQRVREMIQQRTAQKKGAMAKAAASGPRPPLKDWSGLVPITDLRGKYKGQDGGLYGGGHNEPPPAQEAAWIAANRQITPLDAAGRPAKDGKIVLLTIGFSNTSMESADFVRSGSADARKAANVILVNGSIGGRAAVMWAWDGSEWLPKREQARLDAEMDTLHMPKHGRNRQAPEERDTWPTAYLLLKRAGVTPQQVQAVWMKHVEAYAAGLGEFPAHAEGLHQDIIDILQIAHLRYPNLKAAFLSSRTYGGWAAPNAGSPEPYAYESGFGVRWVIQDQIRGDPRLNFDSAKGEVRSPVAIWGPYLWASGDRPRATDGLTWAENDVRANDHMHPSEQGTHKVTKMLLNFLENDPGTSAWFLSGNK